MSVLAVLLLLAAVYGTSYLVLRHLVPELRPQRPRRGVLRRAHGSIPSSGRDQRSA